MFGSTCKGELQCTTFYRNKILTHFCQRGGSPFKGYKRSTGGKPWAKQNILLM